LKLGTAIAANSSAGTVSKYKYRPWSGSPLEEGSPPSATLHRKKIRPANSLTKNRTYRHVIPPETHLLPKNNYVYRDLIENVRISMDKFGGLFRAVIADGEPESTKTDWNLDPIWWRWTYVNEDTGEFEAEEMPSCHKANG
jgi:hypothetical protein